MRMHIQQDRNRVINRIARRYVRRILVQSAWAAPRWNDCVLQALFFRTAQRRGLKKAAVAVAHRILIRAWHILAEPAVEYRERGGDHFDCRNPERTARNSRGAWRRSAQLFSKERVDGGWRQREMKHRGQERTFVFYARMR